MNKSLHIYITASFRKAVVLECNMDGIKFTTWSIIQ